MMIVTMVMAIMIMMIIMIITIIITLLLKSDLLIYINYKKINFFIFISFIKH